MPVMRILKKQKNEVTIKVTNLDDLWYLSQVIDPGDKVQGKTVRKIKLGEETERQQKVAKKAVFLEIAAEHVEFSKSTHELRVKGTITQGPDDIARGSYHSFSVEAGTVLTLIKEEWLQYQLEKLKEASEEKTGKVLIVVFDREEAIFALLQNYGIKELGELKGKVQKKADTEKIQGNFYREIYAAMKEYAERYQISHVIVASQGFWKEYLMKEVADEELRKKIILATCSSVGKAGINEVLKRDEVKQALQHERAAEEIGLVEELLAEIGKQNLAAYGEKEVSEAVAGGAAKTLLVTDTFLFGKREKNTFSELDALMRAVEGARGKVHIISADHEGGKKLNGLGGVAALLRYKIK